jgi:energy-coupling factor transport system permease protein
VQVNLLREVKGDSPVHRLWAGTKLLVVAGLSVTLSYFPSWGAIGLVTALLLATTVVARIPAGAWPRPPKWFWGVLVLTGALTSMSGGSPHVRVVGADLGLGGIDAYGRFMAVGILLILAAAVLGWTTPLGEMAPAVAKLLWPLSLVRIPVEEAAATIALSVRSLPLLVGEMRTLIAARRLRPRPERPGRSDGVARWLDELVDLMVAAMAVSVRRAGDLAEAITARGGTGMIAARARGPRTGDLAVLVAAAGVCYAAATFPT